MTARKRMCPYPEEHTGPGSEPACRSKETSNRSSAWCIQEFKDKQQQTQSIKHGWWWQGRRERYHSRDAPLFHDSNDNFLVLFLPFTLACYKLHLKHRTGSMHWGKSRKKSLYFELHLVPRFRQSEQAPFALFPIREILNRYSQVNIFNIFLGLHNLPFLYILFNNN